MTRLRVTIVVFSVVLFSLALGIALGGGPLQGPVRGTLQSQVEAVGGADEQSLLLRNRALAQAARYDRGFAQALSGDLLDDRLAGRSTLVLALPGVPEAVSGAVTSDIQAAGGTVTATLRAGHELVAPAARPLVDELSQRLLADVGDVDLPEDASVYTRTGAVLSRALLTSDDGGDEIDESAGSILNTLTTARLLRGTEPQQRADSLVVLLPEATPDETASGGRGLILTELVAAMDDASDGVVVAGPASSAQRQGMLAAVRSSPLTADDVSTVDSTGARGGQVTTVLALAEQVAGGTGHYGVGRGADALLPDDALTE